MAVTLPVYVGGTQRLVAVNGNGRIDIYTAAGAATEITNSPDALGTAGGKFPVFQADGTEVLVQFHITSGNDPTPIGTDIIGPSPGAAGQGSRGLS